MITAIREARLAKGLTLDQVACRCIPPTTAQTVGRLEMGTRTVSVDWLNRIAAALDVAAADLVTLPERVDLPVVAVLDGDGARAPRRPLRLSPPAPGAGWTAITVAATVGDYRAGDELWCAPLAPGQYASAINRDVLVPQPGGRFAFGRLIACRDDTVDLMPAAGDRPVQRLSEVGWIARVARLIRSW